MLASFWSAVPMAVLLPPHRTEFSDIFKGPQALPCLPPSQSQANPCLLCSSSCPGFPSLSSEEPWFLTGHSLLLPVPRC